jgi:histone deacetylase 6
VEYVDATQRLFYEDPNVLCISVHRSSHPEEGKVLTLHGRPTERGAGAGEGFNVNVPWPREVRGAQEQNGLFSCLHVS